MFVEHAQEPDTFTDLPLTTTSATAKDIAIVVLGRGAEGLSVKSHATSSESAECNTQHVKSDAAHSSAFLAQRVCQASCLVLSGY